ncbi:DUF2785 domain-containing protein [Terribacillus sp. DMT04]|uniref:DUF2785 domain-containing protein n=1 Tax=Terribacillus sp. DMT04 TaxID=2850441 RepID=UPI001C2BCFD9|nr:DUF2785 domain-containing protein [Terribacillus sp. DMT04]QXE01338.1 DUF2785 domain-containing protein [Terribacillus sp. DMT04]
MERDVLKRRLEHLAADSSHLNKEEINHLVPCMLLYIGDRDSVLRDRLIYGFSSSWIAEGMVSSQVMIQILEKVISRAYLFHKETYTRSFSTLWVAALLNRHRQEAYLSAAMVQQVYDALYRYIEQESNGEGYDETHGWIHTLAHAADALDELIVLPEITADQRLQLVSEIVNKMAFPFRALAYEEDERMAVAVKSSLQSGVDPEKIADIVEKKAEQVLALWPESTTANLLMRSNFKQFIRSLYFCLTAYPSLQAMLYEYEQLFSGIYHKNQPS